METGNIFAWVLPDIRRLGGVRGTKSGTNVSNKMLLNTAKYQGYNFCCFLVVEGRPRGLTQIMVKGRFTFHGYSFLKND